MWMTRFPSFLMGGRTLDLPRFPDLPEKAPFLPVREERGNVQGN